MLSPQFNISQLTPLFTYIKKQREVAKNRHLFELSLTFALISFFLFFAIRPTVLTISSLLGDIQSKQILSAKMTAKIDQIITAQDNFALIQEKYYLIEDALPSTQNFVGALNQIDMNSLKNNIILDKLSFSQSDKNFFSTQISTSSTFSSGLNLIDSLLKNRRLIDIPQVTFSQDKDTQTAGKVNFILPLNIFFGDNQNEKK